MIGQGLEYTRVFQYNYKIMEKTPQHVVLFPDGNRRWALKQGMSIADGYLKGKDKFNDFLLWCKKRGVKVITVFGFSSENWKRPQDQIDFLMHVLQASAALLGVLHE